ncbi:MAG: hypothetical protein AB7F89_21625 [Pirellulaceae bacterium]
MVSQWGKRWTGWAGCFCLACVLSGLAGGAVPATAQDNAPPGPAAAAGEPTAPKKLTGRLPAYYGEVVSKEQRTKIYELQAKFGDQIQKLREQIELLEKQLQDEMVAVLTPEQRDQVMKRTADAKAKRAPRTPRGADPESP